MQVEQRIAVLIAEDCEDNRFLLDAYCKNSPYLLTFAEDGEKAVSAYRSGGFDMVIMDVQMPVMDGLSATRMIRNLEMEKGLRRTPILALTANVMPHDVTQAHEAGCDVHLAKPISKRGFLSALDRWQPPPLADRLTVRIAIPEGLEQLAAVYLAARQKEMPIARKLLEDLLFEDLRRRAHDWKGTGTSYGFPDITRLAGQIEADCVRGDETDASLHLEELAAYVAATGEHLRRLA